MFRTSSCRARTGATLLDVMATVLVLGVLAALALPRAENSLTSGKRTSCHVQRAEVELQASLWRRESGAWPAANLSDVGADADFFPEGLPTCPVDGAPYTINAATGVVVGHSH